jgi:hypothetical protein
MIIEDKRYEIDEVFRMIGEEYLSLDTDKGKKNSDIVVDGFRVHPISLRYMTFYQKGTACAYCGKVGTHFKLCGDPDSQRRHFNLFADDGSLITKDHIVPKVKAEKTVFLTCSRCARRVMKRKVTIILKLKLITSQHSIRERVTLPFLEQLTKQHTMLFLRICVHPRKTRILSLTPRSMRYLQFRTLSKLAVRIADTHGLLSNGKELVK